MAKNLLFVLLFSSFGLDYVPVYANFDPVSLNPVEIPTDECSAPTPDSFRVTAIGDHFIALAWAPAWPGATHTLSVSKKDATGAWILQYILQNVPDSTIVIDSLEGGKAYRFAIATKCPNGDPSTLVSVVDHIVAIVELTLAGRTPNNPMPIKCDGIPYQDHKWVGFKIEGGGASGLFEVIVNDLSDSPLAYINRIGSANTIVAAHPNNLSFPTQSTPEITDVWTPFSILHNGTSSPNVGKVSISVTPSIPPKLDLCQDPDTPWKSEYSFTVLTAKEMKDDSMDGGKPNNQQLTFLEETKFSANSPFKDMLHVFVPYHLASENEGTIRLLNLDGQVLFSEKFKNSSSKIEFPLPWLNSGVYILHIETKLEITNLIVVKS